MKPEQLKVIAEGMGYQTRIYNGSCVRFKGQLQIEIQSLIEKGLNYYNWYRPHTTNNDQMVEIMEKLFEYKNLHVTNGDGIWVSDGLWKIQVYKDGYVAQTKTINEAVCNAAWEHFKDKL